MTVNKLDWKEGKCFSLTNVTLSALNSTTSAASLNPAHIKLGPFMKPSSHVLLWEDQILADLVWGKLMHGSK